MIFSLVGFAVLLSAGPVIPSSDDVEDALQSLKQAESQKDTAQLKKLAVELWDLARKSESAPLGIGEDKESRAKRVEYLRSLESYAEYALAAGTTQAPAATVLDLLSTLERQNPKSKYLGEAYARYFIALNETGAAAQIPAVAEKAVQNFPDNEDILLVLADNALTKKQSDRALGYARRLTATMSKHPRPEGMTAADWERRRSVTLGRGHWIAGMVLSEKTQYYEADKSLRAALPFIKGNDAMVGPALYFLGVANYHLGKMTMNKAQVLEAVKFSEQAAAIPKSAYAQLAWRNALVMKTEAAQMR